MRSSFHSGLCLKNGKRNKKTSPERLALIDIRAHALSLKDCAYMRAPSGSVCIPIWAFPYRRISITRDGDSSRFAPVRAPMPSSIVYCLLISNQSTSSHPASLCVRLSRVQKKPTCAPIQCPSTAWNGSPALVQCLPSVEV